MSHIRSEYEAWDDITLSEVRVIIYVKSQPGVDVNEQLIDELAKSTATSAVTHALTYRD